MSEKKKFIKSAIKRPGALSKRADKEGKTVNQQADYDMKKGTPLEKKQANFYLGVLKESSKKRKKSSLMK